MSALNQAGYNFLEKIRISDPILYSVIEKYLPNNNNGMGAVSDIWDSITTGISEVISVAPEYYASKEQAKAQMDQARSAADFEIQKAQLQLQQQMFEAQQIQQAAFTNNQMDLAQQQEQRINELQEENQRAGFISDTIANLTGAQKVMLGIAAFLALGLVANRMGWI